jgi:hypothetical protein
MGRVADLSDSRGRVGCRCRLPGVLNSELRCENSSMAKVAIRSNPSKRRNLTPLAALLVSARAGASAQSGNGIDRESWRQILGDRIAQRSKPEFLHGNTLTVLVASSVWAQELSLLGPEIIQRLRQAGFSIDELRWRVGQLPEPARQKTQSPTLLPLRQLPSELTRTLSAVRDSELRDAIFQAATHIMARQENASRKLAASATRPIAPNSRCAEPRISRSDPSDLKQRAGLQRTREKQQD